jgi:hypothetical protein
VVPRGWALFSRLFNQLGRPTAGALHRAARPPPQNRKAPLPLPRCEAWRVSVARGSDTFFRCESDHNGRVAHCDHTGVRSNAAAARSNLGLGSVVLEGPPARAYAEYTTTGVNITTAIPIDNSKPQNTEGEEIVTASITLKRCDSRVRVRLRCFGESAANFGVGTQQYRPYTIALFKDSDADALDATPAGISSAF